MVAHLPVIRQANLAYAQAGHVLGARDTRTRVPGAARCVGAPAGDGRDPEGPPRSQGPTPVISQANPGTAYAAWHTSLDARHYAGVSTRAICVI
jgi:hypothetical protein